MQPGAQVSLVPHLGSCDLDRHFHRPVFEAFPDLGPLGVVYWVTLRTSKGSPGPCISAPGAAHGLSEETVLNGGACAVFLDV